MKAVFLWGPARCMHGRCRIRDANCAAPPHADARRRPSRHLGAAIPARYRTAGSRGQRFAPPGAGFIGGDPAPPLAAAYASCRPGLAYGRVDIAGWTRAFSVVAGAGATVFYDRPRSFGRGVARPAPPSTTVEADIYGSPLRQSAADVFRPLAALSRKPHRTGPHHGNGTPRLSVRSARNPVHNRGRRSHDSPSPVERRPPAQYADRDGAEWTAADQAPRT